MVAVFGEAETRRFRVYRIVTLAVYSYGRFLSLPKPRCHATNTPKHAQPNPVCQSEGDASMAQTDIGIG